MAIEGITQGAIKFPGNPLGSDLAARSIPNPFPLEQTESFGISGLPAAGTEVSRTGTFGENLQKAIAEIETKTKEADSAALRYASGESIPIHTVIIAAEQARLSIALAAEVRNKVLEAYQELSRTAG
jgi:flagellar hook-basal body complex protein FliE